MTEGGSVWDTGPQYPEMWPEQADGASAPADLPPPDALQDTTPTTGSPVDIDTPMREPAPAAPPPAPVKKEPPPPALWQRAVLGFPLWILFAFIAIVAVVFFVIVRSGDPGTTSADKVQTTETPTTLPSQVLTTTLAPATTAVPPTTAPAPATTAAAATTAPPIATVPSAPATPPPTSPPTLATTLPPATQPPPTAAPTVPPATLPPNGPVVTLIGSVGPCRFGPECLLAGFALHNFASQPSEFVCEFADGSRFTFHFTRQEVERACATGDPTDTITIEVDGVRSATFAHP